MQSVQEYLSSKNPLTREVALFLSAYDEEDDRVDYKQTFNPTSEKEWLEITKDISAFANTFGGYLVFGISDNPKIVVGLSRAVANVLKNVNNLLQKINRNLEPQVALLRAKEFRLDGSSIVVLYIPQSTGETHLISKDASFKHLSGKSKTVLHKGTFYVRRSAANHLGDSRDLDHVIERRIDQFRESLLDKVARVVRSPSDSDLFILTQDPSDEAAERFIIEDSPNAIPIKGMSFTVAPEGDEQEIAAWTVLSRGSSESRPSPIVTWRWYARRENIEVAQNHRLALFKFSLWNDVPSFYWIRHLKAQVIRDTLLDSIRSRPSNDMVPSSLIIAAFLGKRVYSRALAAIGPYRDRLATRMKSYPKPGSRIEYGQIRKAPKQSHKRHRSEQLKTLNNIAAISTKDNKLPPALERYEARKIDCFLYAQDDQYL